MALDKLGKIQEKLELFTKKWGFFAIIFLILALPPFTAEQYLLSDWPLINQQIVTHPIKPLLSDFYWVFKVIPFALIISVFLFGNRARKIFSLYAAVNYGFFAVFQSISITDQHNFAICSSNLILFLLISAFWLLETVVQKNAFTSRKPTLRRFWVLIPAALSFWEPIHPVTLMPDFSFTYLLTSGAGLSFCMMTPVYIAIITIFYPTVNLPLLRVTSIIGAIIGLGNVGLALIQISNYWWVGIMHIPLIIVSIYGLILSYTSFLNENC